MSFDNPFVPPLWPFETDHVAEFVLGAPQYRSPLIDNLLAVAAVDELDCFYKYMDRVSFLILAHVIAITCSFSFKL